ncbi:glycosyl hydrolase 115 family protein [Niastella sp. OAS944]|uniref:glycosyl hydrolase 115 family protein n=1 Tax=Niastella sp. OAS944 TaxID=2664089 RepID=UPI003485186A|nr:hypothetical protein [Chitinophagaceae bacterium OAS944]
MKAFLKYFFWLTFILYSFSLSAQLKSTGFNSKHMAAAQHATFPIVTKANKVTIVYDKNGPALDSILANLLAEDIERVTSCKPRVITAVSEAKGNVIVIGSVELALIKKIVGEQSGFIKQLTKKWERFGITIVNKPSAAISKALVIAGSDARGTSYGVFTLSEKIGVSPWSWWADAPVKKKTELTITQNSYISSVPAVKYRGIFINDEDWGLQPWAAKTFEPETGDIGPKTYAKVFELLLRLKGNLIWPAMHPSTKAFFHYPGNVKAAADYQIVIGSSHAEPMLRNNVDEWNEKTMGHFNYLTNKEQVEKYWEDRIKETSGINAIYTLGMRGIHDGQMEGVKDMKEAVPVVEQIIRDERALLSKYIDSNVTTIPQVLTPYKEVLEIYDNGLKVPNDVTLVWPDDNYGYIHRLNNENETGRKGGAGVYYHASYWGRPHDYLWLPSTHPSLVREEMMKAYETGASRLWVLNAGDIKPQEYNIQQFLDMAWDPAPFKDSKYTKQHLLNWATSIFGKETAQIIQPVLWEYFQLAFERRPEFMGWSQTEPITQTTYTAYNHFYYGDEAQKRIDRYDSLEAAVKRLRKQIRPERVNAFYQLVYYPVVNASWINKKFLYRDKCFWYAKQNRLSAYDYAQLSKAAYDSIVKETEYFNSQLANGKWQHMMSMNPRNLPVYQPPVLPPIAIDSTIAWNIMPEGYATKDSSLISDNDLMSLPSFDDLNRQKYFVDIFLSKNETLKWIAIASHPWIRLSKSNGVLTRGQRQTRIWVDVDWNRFSNKEKAAGAITFAGGDRKMVIRLQAATINKRELAGYKGFIENNGFISIRATNFTRQTKRGTRQWNVISDFGYARNVLQAFPLSIKGRPITAPDSVKRMNAVVEYDFYTLSSATPSITVYAIPTHPVNNHFSLRYALSIDDGPLKIVDIKTVGRSEEWKQNVLSNRAERIIPMPFLKAGKHTLKIYAVDPGVILDEIRIDTGGLIKAYSTVPETRTLHDQ